MSMLNKKLLAAGVAAGSLLLWGCQDRGPETGQLPASEAQQQGTGGSGEEGLESTPAPESTTLQGTGGSGETGLNTEADVSGTGPESMEQPNPDGLGDTSGTADTTMDSALPSGQGTGDVAAGGLGGSGDNTDNTATGEERVTDPRMEPGADLEPGTGGAGFDGADGVTGTTGEDTGTPGTQSEPERQEP